MKPIPTTGRDWEIRITASVEKDAQMTEQDQAADPEYLPMDVFVDSETRHAHFHFTSEPANRRESRRKICS
jgi:hypothetical protein